MKTPKLYSVLWHNTKGELKVFETDSEHSALHMEVRRNGTSFIDTRYVAKMRLYKYLNNKLRLS